MKLHRIMIVTGVLLIGLIVGLVGITADSEMNTVDQSLIRLHVIANSDSLADQTLKYKVRDAVIAEMAPIFSQVSDIEEVRYLINKHLPKIEEIAKNTVWQAGETLPVRVDLGLYNFPTKSYGQLTLPAGRYQAVRIVIGEGQGANWWCVLFPPLCFVNISNSIADNMGQTMGTATATPPVTPQIKLKSWEWWQSQRKQMAGLMD